MTEDEAYLSEVAEAESSGPQLAGGTYEIIRGRLGTHAEELRGRLAQLNQSRKQVFGAIDTALLSTARIATDNNCLPRDMVPLGSRFLFGYNVHLGLRSQMQ